MDSFFGKVSTHRTLNGSIAAFVSGIGVGLPRFRLTSNIPVKGIIFIN
jgi:hypothetical protein